MPTLVPSHTLCTQLSSDAQRTAGGTLGPLVVDLPKHPEALSSRSSSPNRGRYKPPKKRRNKQGLWQVTVT